VTSHSTLVINGDCKINNVYVDGTLVLESNNRYESIKVDDKKYGTFKPLQADGQNIPEYLKIRGFYLE